MLYGIYDKGGVLEYFDGTWIGWIVKMFYYINRVNLTLLLSVYEGTWAHSHPLIVMHLLDRSCVIVGNFFEIA